jgi:hypothetical protein
MDVFSSTFGVLKCLLVAVSKIQNANSTLELVPPITLANMILR